MKNYVGKIFRCVDKNSKAFNMQGIIVKQGEWWMNGNKFGFKFITLGKGVIDIPVNEAKAEADDLKDHFTITKMDKNDRDNLKNICKSFIELEKNALRLESLKTLVNYTTKELEDSIDKLGADKFYNKKTFTKKLEETVCDEYTNNFNSRIEKIHYREQGVIEPRISVSVDKKGYIYNISLLYSKDIEKYVSESSYPFLYSEYDGVLFVDDDECYDKDKEKLYIKTFNKIEKDSRKGIKISTRNDINVTDDKNWLYVEKYIYFELSKPTDDKKELDKVVEFIFDTLKKHA